MRKARVMVNGVIAGELEQANKNKYYFHYLPDYHGIPISLTMPIKNKSYEFDQFPPFFEGLLPEGVMLDALVRKFKLDKTDYLGQLLKVGQDVVGAVTIEEIK